MAELTCALGPDTAGTLLTAFIEKETERIDAAVYEVGPYYAHSFLGAHRRGAAVRVIVDSHPFPNPWGLAPLQRTPGVEVAMLRLGRREAHWKVITAGDAAIAIGSGNLIKYEAPRDSRGRLPAPQSEAAPGSREWWVFARDVPSTVTSARRRIQSAWAHALPALIVGGEAVRHVDEINAPKPVVAPLLLELDPKLLDSVYTGAGLRSIVEAMLAGVQRRALITVPYVHVVAPAVHGLLHVLAELRGADVRILLGHAHPTDGDISGLVGLGLQARVMDPHRSTTGHAKGVVADDSVLVMSANFSEAGLGDNLEAGMRIDHPEAAEYYADAFERDWAVADPVG